MTLDVKCRFKNKKNFAVDLLILYISILKLFSVSFLQKSRLFNFA